METNDGYRMASMCLLSIDGVNLDPILHTFLNIRSLTALQ